MAFRATDQLLTGGLHRPEPQTIGKTHRKFLSGASTTHFRTQTISTTTTTWSEQEVSAAMNPESVSRGFRAAASHKEMQDSFANTRVLVALAIGVDGNGQALER